MSDTSTKPGRSAEDESEDKKGSSPRPSYGPGRSLRQRFNDTDNLANRLRGRRPTPPSSDEPGATPQSNTPANNWDAPDQSTRDDSLAAPRLNDWAAPDAADRQGTTSEPRLNDWEAPNPATRDDSLPTPGGTSQTRPGIYDDGPKGFIGGLKNALNFDDSIIGRIKKRGKNKEGADSPEALKAKEASPEGGWKTNVPNAEKGVGSLDRKDPIRGGFFERNQKGIGRGGIVAGLLLLLMMFLLPFSTFKVIHYGEVMAAATYARFNSIMVERTTQNIFDASLVEGDGSVTARGKTVIDKMKFRNLDLRLAELGRQGQLKFELTDNNLKAVRVGDTRISLDDISKKSGFGNEYSKLGIRERARVKFEFTKQMQNSVGDTFATEAKYVRGRIFGTVADKVGFKFSSWRQKGRDFIGKSPVEAVAKDAVESMERTTQGVTIEGLPSEIKGTTDQIKNADKLKAFIEKNGGIFDEAAKTKYWTQVQVDVGRAVKLQEIASKFGTGILIASMACIAHEAFSHVDDVTRNNQTQAQREGLDFIAARDQAKSGEITPEAMGARAQRLSGSDQSPDYKLHTNQPVLDGTTDVPRVTPDSGSSIASVVAKLSAPSTILGPAGTLLNVASALPFVPSTDDIDKAFCSAILNPYVAIGAAVLELVGTAVAAVLTGGAAAAADAGALTLAKQFVKELGRAMLEAVSVKSLARLGATVSAVGLFAMGMQFAASMLSSAGFLGASQGPEAYSEGAIGNDINQNVRERSMGGAPMSPDETKAADTSAQVALEQKWKDKGPIDRYFAIDNPFSLVGSVAAVAPTSVVNFSSMVRNGVSRTGSLFSPTQLAQFFSPLTSLGVKKASAASDYTTHQTTQWGWTDAEKDKMRFDQTFSVTENYNYISEAQLVSLDASIGKCFDPARVQYDVDNDSDCTREKLGRGADPVHNDLVLRYRIARFLDPGIGETIDTSLTTQTTTTTTSVATTPATATNSKLFMLGDSLTVGMNALNLGQNSISNRLVAAGWQPTIDAEGCRMLFITGGSKPGDPNGSFCPKGTITDAFTELSANTAAISQAGVIVIALGTNKDEGSDEVFRTKIDEFIAAVRKVNATAPIYWVNVYNRSGKLDNRSAIIQAQSVGKYSVIDLRSEIIAHPEKYPFADANPDQVHHTTVGYSNEAAFIVQQLGSAPNTSSTGWLGHLVKSVAQATRILISSLSKHSQTIIQQSFFTITSKNLMISKI